MARKLILYILLIFVSTHAKKEPKIHKLTMEWKMEDVRIVPYVFPGGPKDSAFIQYPIHPVRGIAGTVLSHEDAQKRPIIYWNALSSGFYTLAMVVTDYYVGDYESDYYNEYVHWLVVNIPGRRVRLGTPLIKYNIPPKPYNNGTSYMVFLMYKQQDKFNDTVLARPIINDGTFRIFQFAYERDMTWPDAGNFFELRYDVYINRTTTVSTTTTKKKKKKVSNKKKKKH